MERQISGSQRKKPALTRAIKSYLLLFNVTQFLGRSWMLYCVLTHYAAYGTFQGVWAAYVVTIRFCETASTLEIANAALGLTSSSAIATFTQIMARCLFVWLIPDLCIELMVSHWITLTLLCWTLTEIIRHLFYISGLINARPYALLWLRYSLFIVLYPCGVTGELISIYIASPYYVKTGTFSIQMPNTLNFTFYFPYVIIFLSLLYIPSFPRLYLHMLSQRKRILGPAMKTA